MKSNQPINPVKMLEITKQTMSLSALSHNQIPSEVAKLQNAMPDKDLLARLEGNVEEWNRWRKENAHICVDLSNANLSNANLSNANLSNANLSNANLHSANLSNANLSNANLSKANLRNANLHNANLSNADLSYATLRRVKINEQTQLDRKWQLVWKILNQPVMNLNLKGADLSNANLRSADLINANLSSANLSKAVLIDANFWNANLSGANLSKADLRSVTFIDANLNGANLNGANLGEANLNNANLGEANLNGANLSAIQTLNTNFEGATLTGACILNWNCNSQTILNNVVCEYIYLNYKRQNGKLIYIDRCPYEPNRIFEPGEFIQIFQKIYESFNSTAKMA